MFKIENEERLKAAIYILLKQIESLDSKMDSRSMSLHIKKELAGYEEFNFSDVAAEFQVESPLRDILNPATKKGL